MLNENFYIDFLKLLNKYEVQYMMIGGYAVNIHGYSRFTGDLDIWSSPQKENLSKLITAIDEFGYDTDSLQDIDLYNESPVKLSEGVLRIEILHKMTGCEFEAAYKRSKDIEWSGIKIKVIGIDDLIANKESTNRFKDLADAYYLKEIKKIGNNN